MADPRFAIASALLFGLAGACARGEPAAMPTEALSITTMDTRGVMAWLAQRQGKPVLANFWATWCAPCVAELPDLLAATRDFRSRGGVVVAIAMERMADDIAVDAALAKVRKKADELHLDVPVLLCTDDDMNVVRKVLGVELGGFPQTLTYDRTGKLVEQHEGMADAEQFAELARAAER